MRQTCPRSWIVLLVVLLVVKLSAALLGGESLAGRKKAQKIEPGPSSMSSEERQIQADPEAGIEHGVILIEETERSEELRLATQTTYHLRAKILSNEGRDLANVQIPALGGDSVLKTWWGKTILPDGKVLHLDQSELKRQSIVSSRGANLEAWKGALPGVVPGCVIDYGYVVREADFQFFDRIPLQRGWPIREFHYRWKPSKFYQGVYHLSRVNQLDVDAEVKARTIFVEGRNLTPVDDEPLMPPDDEVRGMLTLYYLNPETSFNDFWKDIGRVMDRIVRDSADKKRSIQQAIATMDLESQDTLEKKLRAAYDWINANVTRTALRSFEQVETSDDEEADEKDVIADILDRREGGNWEIHQYFIAVARELGADADMVLVTDRRDRFLDEELRTIGQFDGTVVAVRAGSGAKRVVVDPGSGLPYGTVPWWYSGAHGMLTRKTGCKPIVIQAPLPRENVSETEVEMEFTEFNESLLTRWQQKGKGQIRLSERRYLRSLSPDDRTERLDKLCGAGPETEILESEFVGIEDLSVRPELRCESESFSAGLDEDTGEYRFSWSGPWVRSVPDLTDAPRRHPLVFSYPRIEKLHLKIASPEGFVPKKGPAAVEVKGPMGNYSLRILKTSKGFELWRELKLFHVALPKGRYDELSEFLETVREADRTRLEFELEETDS